MVTVREILVSVCVVSTDIVGQLPKKSKSRLVSLSKMNKNARWLEWSEKMRMENQLKKEEFLRKQEEAGTGPVFLCTDKKLLNVYDRFLFSSQQL